MANAIASALSDKDSRRRQAAYSTEHQRYGRGINTLMGLLGQRYFVGMGALYSFAGEWVQTVSARRHLRLLWPSPTAQ